jgi:hypothetical protein
MGYTFLVVLFILSLLAHPGPGPQPIPNKLGRRGSMHAYGRRAAMRPCVRAHVRPRLLAESFWSRKTTLLFCVFVHYTLLLSSIVIHRSIHPLLLPPFSVLLKAIYIYMSATTTMWASGCFGVLAIANRAAHDSHTCMHVRYLLVYSIYYYYYYMYVCDTVMGQKI